MPEAVRLAILSFSFLSLAAFGTYLLAGSVTAQRLAESVAAHHLPEGVAPLDLPQVLGEAQVLGLGPQAPGILLGLGDAAAAADEVEYVNGAATTPMGKLRAANGQLVPLSELVRVERGEAGLVFTPVLQAEVVD